MAQENAEESEVLLKAKHLKQASYKAATLNAQTREQILLSMATALDENRENIKDANKLDMDAGNEKNLSSAFLDRLLLNDKRIDEMIKGLRTIAAMEDKIGYIENMIKRPNGLLIGQMYAPLGVIGIIYEARPNVTVDATGLCIKSGNVILLRGGSEAINSNLCLAKILQEAAYANGFPDGGIEIIENTDHALVDEMVTLRNYIDVLIPRGSAKFIDHIVEIAKVPVIETGAGNCHAYIESDADLDMALEIVFNGKTQRPSVCNATKKILIHKDIAEQFIPRLTEKLGNAGVIFLADEQTQQYCPEASLSTPEEWAEEFLDMRCGIKIVDSLEDAIEHINKYGSHHTETIITRDYTKAQRFQNAIDSAVVMWNASTRFTDGSEFGMGAEIGISTQKLHWRGPMSYPQLMSKKYVIYGTGQVRM
jgi:glutamate-5-semialdehyde dehydrogenase